MKIVTSSRAQAEWISENADQLLATTGDCEVIVECEEPGEEFSRRHEHDPFATSD